MYTVFSTKLKKINHCFNYRQSIAASDEELPTGVDLNRASDAATVRQQSATSIIWRQGHGSTASLLVACVFIDSERKQSLWSWPRCRPMRQVSTVRSPFHAPAHSACRSCTITNNLAKRFRSPFITASLLDPLFTVLVAPENVSNCVILLQVPI